MGVRILEGNNEGDSQGAVFYCSTTMWAFGPVWDDHDQAERFFEWYREMYPRDMRELTNSELEDAADRFRVYETAQETTSDIATGQAVTS